MLQKYFKTLKRKSGPNRNVSTLIETLTTLQFVGGLVRWLRGTVVERRYMTGEHSLCRFLSQSDCKYSLNPLNQTRIDEVRLNRIRCTSKLSCNLAYGNHQAYCGV